MLITNTVTLLMTAAVLLIKIIIILVQSLHAHSDFPFTFVIQQLIACPVKLQLFYKAVFQWCYSTEMGKSQFRT